MSDACSRREALRRAAASAAALLLPTPLAACGSPPTPGSAGNRRRAGRPPDADVRRLADWTAALRGERGGEDAFGRRVIHAGELAAGTPYEPATLESYLRAGGSPTDVEPLTLSLTRFDCVTLVESCLAVARVAGGDSAPTWERFGREIERVRYRGGHRRGYASRLHYFSEWIADGTRRGLVRDVGAELGGAEDTRPLRFMTEHRGSYPALADDAVFREIGAIERRLDAHPRRVVPAKRIPEVTARIETGDLLAFATEIPGLDVTHSALAYRDGGDVLRVLHAPLSGGVVEITSATLPEYVAKIRRATGILVARPQRG
ncbi:MAG TPA: N-acetylmuramoyl-L-alanine amidase-like domain-containing protein [Gemmatimonadales bacterium]|nr:N-acetylmuramoyl-L-alanine amidase-like domain-containing protein [Gemmatimonadales bacterium]